MKTKTWVLVFAALALLLTGAAFAMRSLGQGGSTAEIYVDGKLTKTVSLLKDDSFTIGSDDNWNRVEIKDGQIAVAEASCPDGVCVTHGAAKSGDPIVCLPNRLVIKIPGSTNADATAG